MGGQGKVPNRALQGELIVDDRACVTCNYDLKGLRTGQKCPECGTVIKGGRARRSDSLTDAPLGYLRALRLGALMMAGGSVGACLFTFLTYASQNVFVSLAALGAAGAWWAGVWIVTSKERHNPAAGKAPADGAHVLRVVNRVLQSGWVVAVLLLVVACFVRLSAVQARAAATGALNSSNPFFSLSTLAGNLEWVHGLVLPVCLLTLIPVALHVGRIAQWAEDDELKTRMVLVAWGIGIGGPLGWFGMAIAKTMPSGLALVFAVGRVFGLLMLIASWVAFLWGMLTLASIAAWAVANAVTRIESEGRLAERLARHYESIAPDVEKLGKATRVLKAQSLPGERRVEPSSEGPIPLAEPDGPEKPIRQG
jgi:predicted RNA-binding Zn-ribbon protein involved in translation (DUF1610 family)